MRLKPNVIVFLLLTGGLCLPARTTSAQQAPTAVQSPQSPQPQTAASSPATGIQKEQGTSKKAIPEDTNKVVPDWLMIILRIGREVARLILSWPVVVLVIVLLLALSRTASSRIAGLFTPFSSIKVFGAEFVFTREAMAKADQVLENYTKQVKSEFDRRVEILRLWDKLQNVLEFHLFEKVLDKQKDFRSTIYVPDVLFQDTLYQLLDYYPKGGGRGRRKSLRFGIIGLAWRSARSQVDGDITTDAGELLRNWGMKRNEVTAAGKGRKSFACVVLVDDLETPMGLFYLDCTEKNAFGTGKDQDLIDAITKGAKQTGLIRDLAELGRELRQWSPVIRPHDD